MRQRIALLLAALCVVVCPAERVRACGDKLLLAGREFPYSRAYAAIHPASIVIYLPKAKSPADGKGLASELRRAGHQAEVVGDVQRLTQSLNLGTVDLVLANIVHMQDIEKAAVECPSHPVLLPVLFDASAVEMVQATNQYKFALKAPDTASRFLGTIDRAMGDRPSHVTRKH
jgi:hypothetical protein